MLREIHCPKCERVCHSPSYRQHRLYMKRPPKFKHQVVCEAECWTCQHGVMSWFGIKHDGTEDKIENRVALKKIKRWQVRIQTDKVQDVDITQHHFVNASVREKHSGKWMLQQVAVR